MIANMLCFVFSALVVLLDQFFKRWIVLTMAINGEMELIPGIIKLTRVENYGASFSILSDQRWLLVGISFAACVLLIFIMLRYNEGFWGTLGLASLLGGAASNLFDRVLHGYVVDMFEPVFINFAIFNIADIFITLGGITFCIFFIISSIRGGKSSKKAHDHGYEHEEEGFGAYEDEDEEGVRIYDRVTDSRAAAGRRRSAMAAAHSDENTEPLPQGDDGDDTEQAFYEPGPELLELFENMPEREEYPDSGHEQTEGSGTILTQETFSGGQTPPGTDEEEQVQKLDEAEQVNEDIYDTGPVIQEEEDSARDVLSELESELSDDLLEGYDVDALLREYGFEDKRD